MLSQVIVHVHNEGLYTLHCETVFQFCTFRLFYITRLFKSIHEPTSNSASLHAKPPVSCSAAVSVQHHAPAAGHPQPGHAGSKKDVQDEGVSHSPRGKPTAQRRVCETVHDKAKEAQQCTASVCTCPTEHKQARDCTHPRRGTQSAGALGGAGARGTCLGLSRRALQGCTWRLGLPGCGWQGEEQVQVRH